MIAVCALWLLFWLPPEPDAVSLRKEAGAQFRAGHFTAAVQLYEQAETLQPLDDASRFTYAMALVTLNRRDAAREQLEKLPPTPLNLYWLGRLRAVAANYLGAIEFYQQALALDPEFSRAHDGMGLALQAIGRVEEAETAFRAALRTNKARSPWPAHNLGALFVSAGKYDQAREMLAAALSLDSSFSKSHYELGRIHESLGDDHLALEEYQRAATNADYPEVFYALHRLLRKRGDEAAARAALERFVKLRGR